jgi:hypothetical protein
MQVHPSTYAVLTHKSFPSLESGNPLSIFFVENHLSYNNGAIMAVIE